MINRTSGSKFNITREEKLNIVHHSYAEKICSSSVSERPIAFSVKGGYREFNSKNPYLYKGDTLVSFGAANFTSEAVEFQEPICITKVHHSPPTFKIDNDGQIKLNTENEELWLVEQESFPLAFNITLAFNGFTEHPHFFKYENITLIHSETSEQIKLKVTSKENLKSDNHNKILITLQKPTVLDFKYYCDDCIKDGANITQRIIFGSNLHFANKTLPSVGYVKGKLNFNVNCSIQPNNFTQLKSISFNNESIDVEALQGEQDLSKINFKLINDLFIFKKENPSGILRCNYMDVFGRHTTSQAYESFENEITPLITYNHNNLFFKPNCSMDIEMGKFNFNRNFATLTDNNPNGELSCIYKLSYGEVQKKALYKYFKNKTSASITYPFGDLPIKPECRMDQDNSINLKSVLFNDDSIEVDDLKNATGKTKGNFKMEGKKVIFLGNNPKGKLSCIYKLTHGVYSVNQTFKYFKTPTLPPIKYATDQLSFRPNCSQEPEKNVRLKTIKFNDESIEVGDLGSTSDSTKGSFKLDGDFVFFLPDNPKGKFTCLYTLYKGETTTSQEYELIEDKTLPDVRYGHSQLNFNPSTSKTEGIMSIILKFIVLINMMIVII
uniref:EGF-like domain-containing protein n=1 Tax=Strongyloides papillosus TaxID=174720 RepID=A0A0N5C9L4_STREA